MEQVDATILPILEQIGCKLSVKSISEFESEHVYLATSAILQGINSDLDLPKTMPGGKAAKFRVCTTLANTVEELGYTEKVGYEAFLYPNVKDTRKLLMWLVDKLPKVDGDENEAEEAVGSGATLSRKINEALSVWMGTAWTPFGSKSRSSMASAAPLYFPSAKCEKNAAVSRYWQNFLPMAAAQCSAKGGADGEGPKLAPSLFEFNAQEIVLAQEKEREWNSQGKSKAKKEEALDELVSSSFRAHASRKRGASTAGKSVAEMAAQMMSAYRGAGDNNDDADQSSSAFSRRTDFGQESSAGSNVVVVTESGTVESLTPKGDPVKSTEEKNKEEQEAADALKAEREKKVSQLTEKLKKLKAAIKGKEATKEENKGLTRQMEVKLNEFKTQTETMEKQYKVKKRTLDLLPNAQENLGKLQQLSQASAAKLLQLAQEWENHRVPLVERYRKQKLHMADRKGEVEVKVGQIKRMRIEMKEKAADLREKDAVYKQVLDEFNNMPKSINRQVYVRRIMDIVKNLEKQKVDIKSVLDDVRQVQKDINMLSGKSKRSFDVVDEIVFQEASKKKNPVATQTYKNVVQLRDGFVELVKTVEDTGRIKNEIRDTTSKITALEARNTALNMKRVADDLAQVREENKKLAAQVKKLKNG